MHGIGLGCVVSLPRGHLFTWLCTVVDPRLMCCHVVCWFCRCCIAAPGSFLERFFAATAALSPAERGAYLESPPDNAPDIEEAHQVGGWVGWLWWLWGGCGIRQTHVFKAQGDDEAFVFGGRPV